MNNFQKHLITMYLEYVNNFLTVERFAEYYGISEELATITIGEGKELYSLALTLNSKQG